MGTAYLNPRLAFENRVSLAESGLSSINFPASEHLVDYTREISYQVWFVQQ
jgi:hypothetical protein